MRRREFDAEDPASVQAWIDTARRFAEGASGTAHVVLGTTRPGNIWENVQLPALKANPRIERIVAIDADTGAEETIFER
jgi:hypothetical protein